MNKVNKIFLGILTFLTISFGIVFANDIGSLNGVISTGDIITKDWYTAVNKFLNPGQDIAVSHSDGGFCSYNSASGGIVCMGGGGSGSGAFLQGANNSIYYTGTGADPTPGSGTGKVGIGTITPEYQLHLVGDGRIVLEQPENANGFHEKKSKFQFNVGAHGGSGGYFSIKDLAVPISGTSPVTFTGLTRFTIDPKGKIGIGTSEPEAQLHLKKDGRIILEQQPKYNSSDTLKMSKFRINVGEYYGSGGVFMIEDLDKDYTGEDSADRLSIDRDGKVTIYGDLEVKGNIAGSGSSGAVWENVNKGNNDYFQTNCERRFSIGTGEGAFYNYISFVNQEELHFIHHVGTQGKKAISTIIKYDNKGKKVWVEVDGGGASGGESVYDLLQKRCGGSVGSGGGVTAITCPNGEAVYKVNSDGTFQCRATGGGGGGSWTDVNKNGNEKFNLSCQRRVHLDHTDKMVYADAVSENGISGGGNYGLVWNVGSANKGNINTDTGPENVRVIQKNCGGGGGGGVCTNTISLGYLKSESYGLEDPFTHVWTEGSWSSKTTDKPDSCRGPDGKKGAFVCPKVGNVDFSCKDSKLDNGIRYRNRIVKCKYEMKDICVKN